MLDLDPLDHTGLRSLVPKAFTARLVAQWRSHIRLFRTSYVFATLLRLLPDLRLKNPANSLRWRPKHILKRISFVSRAVLKTAVTEFCSHK